MESSNKTIIGIVVWQHETSFACYIWCKETYVGNDGILYPNPENPVKVGDWVAITFTRQEYQTYFSEDKTKKLPQFKAKNYVVFPEFFKTTPYRATIRVNLEQALTENQHVIGHNFFGNIYNIKNLEFPSGTWNIIIKRVEPRNRDSVWILEEVESVQEPPKDTKVPIIGIIVSHHNGTTFVWCKERPVAHDVILKQSYDMLPVGTWITFSVEKNIFETFFPKELPSDGVVPMYEIQEYTIVEKPIHPTEFTGRSQRTVNLKLEGYVERNLSVQDIFHPFVGLIINESHKFPVSGRYSYTVFRTRPKENPPRSVWFLKNPQLVGISEATQSTQPPTTLAPQPVRAETTLERQLRYMSMDDLSVSSSDGNDKNRWHPIQTGITNQPSSSNLAARIPNTQPMSGFSARAANQPAASNQAALPRPSQPVGQFRASDQIQSQFDFSARAANQPVASNQATLPRPPQPVDQFRASHPIQSEFGFITRTANQLSSSNQVALQRSSRPVHLQSETPPIPAPRRHRSRSRANRSQSRRRRSASRHHRSASRPREPPVVKTGIIYKIMKYGLTEVIHVWLMDDPEQGRLKLEVAAEKHSLELGSVFTAGFVLNGDAWISNGPVKLVHNPDYYYETRKDGQHGIDIRVYAGTLKNAGDNGYKYATIYHHHFGNIIDNFGKLQYHARTKYHMWIRRVNLDGQFEWVVIEQIV